MQVKIFKEEKIKELENDINNFIKDKAVNDIKLSVRENSTIKYIAMVIYKEQNQSKQNQNKRNVTKNA
ncbi:MAG: hypothetical protein LKE46_00635 [Clostridium sp.]|jgi:hypothetical protein|uniref:hypothetical protein n=1 Tax=Clostridium sp. TaxID=1506 RepID=UPI0025C55380|nr:hypothetical protein [Clostridium sp.]MCH3962760.1 hypothetical protein [Clostridium sp.]MCI1715825.1 hypothetical protein [Clostridium sp.]MCI1799970.1 hypothetical protein [Clostridium sp.]MCI1813884.1 hypothetical protein [Clostridium sp.]MCI1870782.1 hypothetical protein [Clostridium sp.]